MRLLHAAVILTLASAAFADTITMKNGRVVQGTYLGGSPRQVRIEVGDEIRNFDVADIVRIEFGSSAAPPPADDRPEMRRRDDRPMPPDRPPAPPVVAAPPAPAGDLGVTLPAGTNAVIRMID